MRRELTERRSKDEVVCFDFAVGGRVPGVLYGSAPPLKPQDASWWLNGAWALDWTG